MAMVQRTKGQATPGKTNGGTAQAQTQAQSPAVSSGAIAQRAYEIWKESGCPNGMDQEHWFRAERELRAKVTVRP